MRKIPLRKCCATMERLPKNELIRVVRCPDGTIIVDDTGKANGRGAYLKKSEDAIKLAIKTRSLEKSLDKEIPEEIYSSLLEKCHE